MNTRVNGGETRNHLHEEPASAAAASLVLPTDHSQSKRRGSEELLADTDPSLQLTAPLSDGRLIEMYRGDINW